jgi:hypothetical protein
MDGASTLLAVGWDSSRPVPWRRLTTEWAIYAAIMAVLFVFVFRDNVAGALLGLAVSYPLYLVFGAVLAKFGCQRRTLRELRQAGERRPGREAATTATSRAKPAPTRRTGGGVGGGRPGGPRRKHR